MERSKKIDVNYRSGTFRNVPVCYDPFFPFKERFEENYSVVSGRRGEEGLNRRKQIQYKIGIEDKEDNHLRNGEGVRIRMF